MFVIKIDNKLIHNLRRINDINEFNNGSFLINYERIK